MFGTSALYHRGNWAAAWHRRLQRLDHAMIFLLIAGTATAVFLIDTHGAARVAGLVTIWALTLAAGGIHMAWMSAPELLVGGTFHGTGLRAGWRCQEYGCIPGCGGNADARGRQAVHHLKLPVRAPSLDIYPERTRPSPLLHRTPEVTSAARRVAAPTNLSQIMLQMPISPRLQPKRSTKAPSARVGSN